MCPCGSAKPYEQCCGPFHRGGNPPTAELLMRARYCAFARKDRDFLLRTWHAKTRPSSLTFDDAITWTGLEIIKTVNGNNLTPWAWSTSAPTTSPRKARAYRKNALDSSAQRTARLGFTSINF